MPTEIISSKDNPLIKRIKKLQSSSKQREKEGVFVIEGLRMLDDAADNNISFLYLLYTVEFIEKFPDSIKKFAQISKKSYTVSEKAFASMCDTKTPQGVLAVVNMSNNKISEVLSDGKYIALENLQDPSNVGAVCRTAEALGISGIFISSDSCDIYSPKVLRSSMGTLLRIPVYVCNDLVSALKNTGLTVYACVVHGEAESLGRFGFEKGSVAVIGNEGNGLSERMINSADKRITVRMKGRAESLNAAAAASIVMWEMNKN